MTLATISVAVWEQLEHRSVKWLDEREYCSMVHDCAHFGDVPTDGELRACPQYRAGWCKRSGNGSCAFEDATSDFWHRARDWRRQADGSMLFDPAHKTIAHRQAARVTA